MDFSSPLFTRLLELSPFVATLFGFLYTIWNSLQKKDDALMSTMKEHQASMLQMQKDSIVAQNNQADAQRLQADATHQLVGVVGDLKEQIADQFSELKAKPKNGTLRRLPTAVAVDAKVGQ